MSDREWILNHVRTGLEEGDIVKFVRDNDLDVHRVIDWYYNIDANKFAIETVCGEFYFEEARCPGIDDTRCAVCFREEPNDV